MYCTEKLPKAKANQLLQSITLLYIRTIRRDLADRLAFDSHLIQSNAFESNANADESNANTSANASAAKESSANANAAFALAFANASAFEHKPEILSTL